MKKQIFLVGALVAVAMSSMFVACADKNTPDDKTKVVAGCTCTYQAEGEERETFEIGLNDMPNGITTCDGFAEYYQLIAWYEYGLDGIELVEDVTCKAYY